MQASHYRLFTAAAVLGLLAVGTAYANDPRVPTTGSNQGEIVPNALPGGGPPHAPLPEGHTIAPSGASPRVGSEAGVQPSNAAPGTAGLSGEARPHADVMSPAGIVPRSSEGAPGLRR